MPPIILGYIKYVNIFNEQVFSFVGKFQELLGLLTGIIKDIVGQI